MTKIFPWLLLMLLTAPLLSAETNFAPLFRAHAHNDYNHKRPLRDALDQKFCSIEADIHLTNGVLLVAHDLKKARPDRTLEGLYLQPLREQILKNDGRVYRDGPTVILLIDLKTGPRATYAALRELLKNYSGLLTKFTPLKIETNAVTVILTGNRAVEIVAAETNRFVACDGVFSDLDSKRPANLIPLVSGEWKKYFNWNGVGEMPADEKSRLRELVSKAHGQGRKIRFWGTPDRLEFWRELFDAGVDLLNADDLAGLGKFLRAQK